MKALSLFYPSIEPHCPGVTTPMMQQALRASAREFCRESNIAQEVVTLSTQANEPSVDVDVPSQQQFVRVVSAQFKNVWLTVAPTGDAPNSLFEPSYGDPVVVYLPDPNVGTLNLSPVPATSETGVLFVRASFMPLATATQLADVLYTDWLDEISWGAIAYLQNTAGTQFFSPQTASAWRSRFDGGVTKAARVAERGKVITSQRVKGRAFA